MHRHIHIYIHIYIYMYMHMYIFLPKYHLIDISSTLAGKLQKTIEVVSSGAF